MVKFSQGEIIYMDFDPQVGHEQMGRCPALVVSNDIFNQVSTLRMVCPITTKYRDNAMHIELPKELNTRGFVMCDQAKMLDLKARHASYEEDIPRKTLSLIIELIISLVALP